MSLDALPALTTAFLAGLLGAGHCFGMCGGIAGALGAAAPGGQAVASALRFNLARVTAYSLLGGVAATVAGLGGAIVGIPDWAWVLRLATALLIALIGLRLLANAPALAVIERLGGRIWQRVAPTLQRAAGRPGWRGQVALGLGWGLLPCGLVYTMLFTAAASGRFLDGAAVMAAFGLGTLPALLGLTSWSPALGLLLRDAWFRRCVGAGLLLLATWTAVMLFAVDGAQHAH